MEQVRMVQLSGHVTGMLVSRWSSLISSVTRRFQPEMRQIRSIRSSLFCVLLTENILRYYYYYLDLIILLQWDELFKLAKYIKKHLSILYTSLLNLLHYYNFIDLILMDLK